jgi:hypothetical protein
MLSKLLPFKESGAVFNAACQIVDPDLADMLQEDQQSPAAMEKERQDEYNAVSQILSGIEPVKPMMASPQLRLQIMQQIVQQPQVQQKVAQDPVAQALLKNRAEFFSNQIQQNQVNPQIGRALSATTFGGPQAPTVSQAPAQ